MDSSSRPPTPAYFGLMEDYEPRFKLCDIPSESPELYRPGGCHPVVLGDILNSRYEIMGKLGYGMTSTVWLATDQHTNKYVTLKIMISNVDEGTVNAELPFYETLSNSMGVDQSPLTFLGLDAHFTVHGPNGSHACFVFQPMGPDVEDLLQSTPAHLDLPLADSEQAVRLPKPIAKRLLRDVLLALQLLHRNGITHGNLHARNILFNIKSDDLNATPPLEVGQIPPDGDLIEREDGKVDLWAPEYLLQPKPLSEFVSFDCEPLLKLIDLGEAFPSENPTYEDNTPHHLRGPERIIRSLKVDSRVDVWSFGCLMYEVLTEFRLFDVDPPVGDNSSLDEQRIDEHLIQLAEICGDFFPLEFYEVWRRGQGYFNEDGERVSPDRSAMSVSGDTVATPNNINMDIDDNSVPRRAQMSYGALGILNGGHDDDVDHLQDDQDDDDVDDDEEMVWWNSLGYPPPRADLPHFLTLQERFHNEKPEDVDEEEEKEIVQILGTMFMLDPEDRPSVDQLLERSWFRD